MCESFEVGLIEIGAKPVNIAIGSVYSFSIAQLISLFICFYSGERIYRKSWLGKVQTKHWKVSMVRCAKRNENLLIHGSYFCCSTLEGVWDPGVQPHIPVFY